jgi:hypothetical protein
LRAIGTPQHLRTLSKNHKLRKWVDDKSTPREGYFETIDGLRAIFKRHPQTPPRPDPDYETLSISIADLMYREGNLYVHVDNGNTVGPSTEEGWREIYRAAAWAMLERYDEAIADGTWTVTDG